MSAMFKVMSATHIALFRASGGRLGSKMRGQDIVLLTTKGNKSGQPRTVPVMCFAIDGKRYLVGSGGGTPQDPAWVRNLRKTPEADIEARGEKFHARANFVTGEERARIFKEVVARASFFGDYEKRAAGHREIPIIELVRG